MHDEKDATGRSLKAAALGSHVPLIHPAPDGEESYVGYRLRVAYLNGIANHTWLGQPSSANGLPKGSGKTRWCPICIAEADPRWLECWTSGPGACFLHNVWLNDRCPRCRRLMTWRHARFKSCSCGQRLAEVEVCRFSADLARVVAYAEDAASEDVVKALSVERRWNLARVLGALRIYGLRGKPLKKASTQSAEVECRLVTHGASILASEEAQCELLEHIRVYPPGRNVPLLSEAFPGLLTMSRTQLGERERRWLMDVVATYVTNVAGGASPVIWERRAPYLQQNAGLTRCATGRSRRLARICSAGGIAPKVRRTRTGRRKILVSDAELQDAVRRREIFVPLKTAARRFGVSVGRMRAMVQSDVVAAKGGLVNVTTVRQLIDRIAASAACSSASDVTADFVSLGDAMRTNVALDATAAFFGLLTRGSFPVLCPPGAATFREILISRSHLGKVQPLPPEHEVSGISIMDAARLMEVKQEVMYHLVRLGLLDTRIARIGRRMSRVVELEALDKFRLNYEPLACLARRQGVALRQAPDWAVREGFELVTGPKIDGGRQYIVRKRPY